MHLPKPSDEQILRLVEAMLDESDMIEEFDSLLSDPASSMKLEAEGRALLDEHNKNEEIKPLFQAGATQLEPASNPSKTPNSGNDAFHTSSIPTEPTTVQVTQTYVATGDESSNPTLVTSVRRKSGGPWSWAGTWSTLVTSAASLFLGLLLYPLLMTPSRRNFPEVFSLTDITVNRGSAGTRGDKELTSFSIKSERPGFVTVVAIDGPNPTDLYVDPSPEGAPIRVTPESPATYLFTAELPSAKWLIFVVTETQADATIIRGLSHREVLPSDAKEMTRHLAELLKETGFHWVEIGSTPLGQSPEK